MTVADVGLYRPLDVEACHALAEALGDTPETVISTHLLRRGMSNAYMIGEPPCFDAAIVQPRHLPTEPVGFGSDVQALWQLLRVVKGWNCILVDSEIAQALGKMIEGEMGVPARYLDDVCHTLTKPVSTYRDNAVRQLTLDDVDLLEAAPAELRDSCWENPSALLTEGITACAIVSGRIVATALTSARSQRHAEVGVYTQREFRRRGLATAAASIVIKGVQETGQTPVWSAGAHNIPSLRVARKLGFYEVGRRTYVILEKGRAAQPS